MAQRGAAAGAGLGSALTCTGAAPMSLKEISQEQREMLKRALWLWRPWWLPQRKEACRGAGLVCLQPEAQGRRDGGRKISRSNISSLSAAAPCEAVPPCECTNRREVELSSRKQQLIPKHPLERASKHHFQHRHDWRSNAKEDISLVTKAGLKAWLDSDKYPSELRDESSARCVARVEI